MDAYHVSDPFHFVSSQLPAAQGLTHSNPDHLPIPLLECIENSEVFLCTWQPHRKVVFASVLSLYRMDGRRERLLHLEPRTT